ncbi:MAG: NAD kinase [Cyclobacteriaceae bacterium]|nr:NAD kinase [Cyclobacteriaceae bacterium]
MKIGVHGKKFLKENIEFIRSVLKEFSEKSCELIFSESYFKALKKADLIEPNQKYYTSNDDLSGLDMMVTLGGDGTLLEAVAQTGSLSIPIWGINLGRMGFLATTSKELVKGTINEVFSGNYILDKRTLLNLQTKNDLFGKQNFALNDFTILKKDTSSMILVHAYINGEFLNSYWADGIIVATPTGSTGYSLSCGGPLILPGSQNFVLTPVSPHNLTARPMVVPDNSILSFKVEGRAKQYLASLDSRFKTIELNTELSVEKAPFNAHLVRLKDSSYFKTLRQKLSWGLDYRN